MPNLTHAQIADLSWQGLSEVPTSISGAAMQVFVDQARLITQNLTRHNIGSNAISEAYQAPIINLTRYFTLARMEGLGVDASSWRLGEFSIEKGSMSANQQLMRSYHDLALLEIRSIPKPLFWSKANG
jgi:hypothetical protein